MNQKNQTNQTKSNSRGGARPNAGRKKSAITVRTREIAEKAISEAREGDSPLEVMLTIMRDLRDAAVSAKQSDDPDVQKSANRLLLMAADVAKDAAPYIHPRLAAVDHTTNGKDMAQTSGVLMAPGMQSEEEWESGAE